MSDAPEYDDPRHLRHVAMIPFIDGKRWTLRIWETYPERRARTGQRLLNYQFKDPEGWILFQGDDYGCAPMRSIDSDDMVRGLLGFLTLRPGDTDREYFASYTPEQMSFARSHACEALSMWADDGSGSDEGPMPFENLDGRGGE
jgi:hypothetical protein